MFTDDFLADGEVLISASVATGFENIAASEVREKISSGKGDVITKQGRVYMKTSKESLPLIHQLRSVDRLFLIVKTCPNYVYKETKEETYKDLIKLAEELHWTEILKFWSHNKQFCKEKSRQTNLDKKRNRTKIQKLDSDDCGPGSLNTIDSDKETSIDSDKESPAPESIEVTPKTCANGAVGDALPISESSVPSHAPDGTQIRFRVSSNRVGKKQPVTSPEASYKFGGHVHDVTNWKVDLSNYNFEILLSLGENSLEVAIALTLQSLHRRNISHFGVTTLRATTAYCMLKMCQIQPGEIVIDPMCGSGAIPVEGALEWPHNFFIGGDNINAAVSRCRGNITFINENPDFLGKNTKEDCDKRMKLWADTIRWDVTNLPMKPNSVDVIITDLPFGKRIGSKVDNRKLYPALLKDLARVTRCGTGRACLLTQDQRSLKRSLNLLTNLWKMKNTLFINIGGLTAGVFLLLRTESKFEDVIDK